jgi:hypothetical protein
MLILDKYEKESNLKLNKDNQKVKKDYEGCSITKGVFDVIARRSLRPTKQSKKHSKPKRLLRCAFRDDNRGNGKSKTLAMP